MRILLFLAVLGVVSKGFVLDKEDPASSAFQYGAGMIGKRIYGFVLLSVSVTSLIGAAYTTTSFLKTLFSAVKNNERLFIVGNILLSTALMFFIGKPIRVLILAGTLNAFILPIALSIILIASNKRSIVGDYKHSKVLTYLGWVVVLLMGYAAVTSLQDVGKMLFGA
ncbi:MAG: divalent metal cation transporter [Phocaeicola sp.]